MKNKRQILDKLDRLRTLVNGWAFDESKGKSEEHKLNIQKIIKSDLEFVNRLFNNGWSIPPPNKGLILSSTLPHITAQDMKKCNVIHKRYSAISNVQFSDKDPLTNVAR